MVQVHRLTRQQARRIMLRTQLLTASRPVSYADAVRGLNAVQLDQVTAVTNSQHLVAWSRLGSSYGPDDLTAALTAKTVFELHMFIRPADSLALYRAEMADWETKKGQAGWERSLREWVTANDSCRRDILIRLASEGPLVAGELPDSCAVSWKSSGWNNNRNVLMLLEQMVARGEVAVAGREGRDKLWDLAERVYPETPDLPEPLEAARERVRRRMRALGIAKSRAAIGSGEPIEVGEAGEPAEVEGVRGVWRVDPDAVAAADEPFEGRTAILSPLDRLVFDRARMDELFEFDYQLEMYKPAAKRRWGYYALPVLHGDKLVGKVDAKADRAKGVLNVHHVHEDEPFDADTADAVEEELLDLAEWLGLELARRDLPVRASQRREP